MRPLLLDLFCGAGGAAMGYHRAGFDVVGVDNQPQPNYPFPFVLMDALDMLRDVASSDGWRFDAIHASPPCHDHSPLKAVHGYEHGTGWMVAATRELLDVSGLPWVIENVPGAPLIKPITMCGGMFGLRTYRHRRFETSPEWMLSPPRHPWHVARTATKRRRERWAQGWHVSITGDVGVYVGPEAMGIDWMSGNELSQAIPPAYTEHIGEQLIRVLVAA